MRIVDVTMGYMILLMLLSAIFLHTGEPKFITFIVIWSVPAYIALILTMSLYYLVEKVKSQFCNSK